MDLLVPLLIVAAILGDTVNYWLGHWIGARAFSGAVPFLKKSHLEKTQAYFAKYGGKTIIIARFVPIVRTFAPFVAGIGAMNYRQFFLYNVVGGIVWVLIFLFLGYWFGNIPFVQKNFELVMVAIVVLSLAPPLWEWWQHRAAQKKSV
jgi:membrane-associated protein